MKAEKLITSLALLLAVVCSKASEVSEQEALMKAQCFMPGKVFTTKEVRSNARGKVADLPNFYVFNADGGGYVIVSGDDRTEAILGYSKNGSLDMEHLPEHIQSWLDGYTKQLDWLQTHPKTSAAREAVIGDSVDPLLEETEWGQDTPYADLCPWLTGCVATAMAQVMFCYKHPLQTTKEIPAYSTTTKQIAMEAIPVKGIDWDNIYPKYSLSRIQNLTETERQAIGNLMLIVGCSLEMDYDNGYGSGAYTSMVPKALKEYFDYDAGTRLAKRELYRQADWEQMIYDEVHAGRPVIYSGRPSDGIGHAFVVDGYDEDGYFHVNWGWNGGSNGYFLLSILNPGYNAMHEDDYDTDGFSFDQNAVIGIQPNTGVTLTTAVETYSASVSQLSSTFTRNSSSEDFSLGVSYHYGIAEGTSKAYLALGLFDSDDNFISTIYNTTRRSLTGGKDYSLYPTVQFGANLPDGRYLLKLVYRETESEEWQKSMYSDLFCIKVNISNNNLVATTTDTSVEKANLTGYLITDSNLVPWKPEAVKAVITNNSSNDFMGNLYFFVDDEMASGCYFEIEAGETKNVDFSFTSTTLGSKNLVVALKAVWTNSGGRTGYVYQNPIISKSVNFVQGDVPYAVYNDGTLAFYNDTQKASRAGTVYDIESTTPGWQEHAKEIKKVVFSPSFAEALPLSTSYWFDGAIQLKEIEGMQYLNTRRVTKMHSMFSKCSSLESVDLSHFNTARVTDMEDMFSYCTALKEIDLSQFNTSRVTTMSSMFTNCSTLTELDVSGFETTNVTSMWSMFYGCSGIKSLDLSNFDTQKVTSMSYMFQQCSGLTSLDLSTFDTGRVTRMTDMFNSCYSLVSVVLGSRFTMLPNSAFSSSQKLINVTANMQSPFTIDENCFWTYTIKNGTLTVPDGRKSVYMSADVWKKFFKIRELSEDESTEIIDFADDATKAICIENWDTNGDKELSRGEAAAVTDIGETFKFAQIQSFDELQYFTGLESLGSTAFGASTIERITIPKSVISITANPLSRCTNLASIAVAEGNTVYDSRNNCNAIIETATGTLVSGCKNTVIPNGVTAIGKAAFLYCPSLTDIVIPEGVTSIGKGAFALCSNLEALNTPSTLQSIETSAFQTCSKLKEVTFSEGLTTIAKQAFEECSSLTSIHIPKSVISIGEGAFMDCGALASIAVAEGNTVYDSRNGCNAIIKTATNTLVTGCNSTVIPTTVNTIGDRAFEGCAFASMEIPEGVEAINGFAFSFNKSLESIKLPESLKTLGGNAFSGCSNLQGMTLPQGLTWIGSYAFNNCKKLTALTVLMPTPADVTLNQGAFTSSSITTLYVPSGARTLYRNANGWQNIKNILVRYDVNNDGYLNEEDVKALADYIMEMPPTGFIESQADVTGDGTVNVADITALINIIRGVIP